MAQTIYQHQRDKMATINRLYELPDPDDDEKILFDGCVNYDSINEMKDLINRRRLNIAKSNIKDMEALVRQGGGTKDKGAKLMKMYYKSSVIESILFQKLCEGDVGEAKKYLTKLRDIFVDIDMYMSDKSKDKNDCMNEGDYKEMTEKIGMDENGISKIIDFNEEVLLYNHNELMDLFEDLDIYREGANLNIDTGKGLLCYTYRV